LDDPTADRANPRAHPENNRKAVLGSIELPDAIQSLEMDGFDIDALGFSQTQLDNFLGKDDDPTAGSEENLPEKWLVVVTCRNQAHQLELLERFGGEGLECSAMVS
jgi:hypothetical protein